MNNFVYHYPVKQYFGKGCAEGAIKNELKTVGKNVLLAYGNGSIKNSGLYDKVIGWLKEAGKTVTEFPGIMPNPTYAKVQEGAKLVRENTIDFILAVGGGSVLDCCKVVSAQSKLSEDIWDMEYIARHYPSKFVPMGAIVTASGTGAEQNNGAVITHEEKKLKQALFGAYYDFAVLDIDLTKTLPMQQVISGAFDTLSHCMEIYMGNPHGTNLSDEINEAVMRNVITNLRAIIANPDNDFARSELMWASAMAENGILKLGKQTDFQCHMIEHAVGAYTDCNHGQGLAVVHPVLYRHIYKSAESKFMRWAQKVWEVSSAEEGIKALANFIIEIGLPTSFTEMGLSLDDATLRAIADSTLLTAGCCKKLSHDDILTILKECI